MIKVRERMKAEINMFARTTKTICVGQCPDDELENPKKQRSKTYGIYYESRTTFGKWWKHKYTWIPLEGIEVWEPMAGTDAKCVIVRHNNSGNKGRVQGILNAWRFTPESDDDHAKFVEDLKDCLKE